MKLFSHFIPLLADIPDVSPQPISEDLMRRTNIIQILAIVQWLMYIIIPIIFFMIALVRVIILIKNKRVNFKTLILPIILFLLGIASLLLAPYISVMVANLNTY